MNILAIRSPGIINNLSVSSSIGLPIGLAYIVGAIRDLANIEVIDPLTEGSGLLKITPYRGETSTLGLPIEEIVDIISQQPDVCLISSMFSMDWPITRTLIDLLKDKYPKCLVIGGGEHFSALPQFSLQTSSLDMVAKGEGEETIREFIYCMSTGETFPLNVAGTILKHPHTHELIYNTPRKRISNLENIRKPAWDLFNVNAFLDHGVGSTSGNRKNFRPFPIVMTRGCPYACTFCSKEKMWGKIWRARPPIEVIEEMREYINIYDVTHFYSCDLTATIKKSWIIEFCNLLIREDLKITWGMPSGTRSEALDNKVLKLLKASGCDDIDYAPESGSDYILKCIGKKINKKSMLQSIRYSNTLRMKTKANIILGFPEEKRIHIMQSYSFAIKMAIAGLQDIAAVPLAAYPGSKIFDDLIRHDKIYLSDHYFLGLSSQGSINIAPSFSKFSQTELYIYKMGLFMVFYFVSFAIRPIRFYNLIKDLFRRRETTRLSAGILRISDHIKFRSK